MRLDSNRGRYRFAVVAAMVASLVVWGCKPEISRPGVKVTEDGASVCKAVAKVACYNMFSCCTGAQIEGNLGITQSKSVEECEADVELLCERTAAVALWGVEQGTVGINAAAYNTCLESLLAPKDACFLNQPEPPWVTACQTNPWLGLVPNGGDCLYDLECSANSTCTPDRKCTPLPQLGEDCNQSPCAQGLFCDFQTGLCANLKGAGVDCNNTQECRDGLYCDFSGAGNPTCTNEKAVGAVCTADFECDSDYCVPGICGDGFACFQDSDCAGQCEGTTNFCFTQFDCQGTCRISGAGCFDDFDCFQAGDSCAQPLCEQTCFGQPVCGENLRVVDYCIDTMAILL